MIVGRYVQTGERKEFREVHEIVLSENCLNQLKGELIFADVAAFHDGLLLSNFPVGLHAQARAWSRTRKCELAYKQTKIILNPKIDSGSQRRLQCSVKLSELAKIAGQLGELTIHREMIGQMILPIIQHSPRRKFS